MAYVAQRLSMPQCSVEGSYEYSKEPWGIHKGKIISLRTVGVLESQEGAPFREMSMLSN
jgi:hypothetical protein